MIFPPQTTPEFPDFPPSRRPSSGRAGIPGRQHLCSTTRVKPRGSGAPPALPTPPPTPGERSCGPAGKGLAPGRALGAGQAPWVPGGRAVRQCSLREEAGASRSSGSLNGRARGSRIAPRGFHPPGRLSPQMHSPPPLPSPLFVRALSRPIFHAPLTAGACRDPRELCCLTKIYGTAVINCV